MKHQTFPSFFICYKPMRFLFFSLLVIITLASSACSKRAVPSTGQLFIPAQHSGAKKVSQEEAEHILQKLALTYQGQVSWADVSFALDESLAYANRRPAGQVALSTTGLHLTYGQLTETLQQLHKLLPSISKDPTILAKEFSWYRIGPDFGVTGYYEPTLQASRTQTNKHYYPLYKKPNDLKATQPYHTRHAIDRQGALKGKSLEIAWVDSETDAFFLHIQGSGRLQFPDGSTSHILYAGKNNRTYKALGRVMKEQGLLGENEINMPNIRRVLAENPSKQAELFDTNPSYIFFREASKGPVGAMGRPLTPWVSIATDRSVLPHGSATIFITAMPRQNIEEQAPFYGLMFPQDTGGAIKNHRIDTFLGPGDTAEHIAGHLNTSGAVYILVKK